MIPEEIRNEILLRLKHAEVEHNVKVLLAVESGSRAWGFASPNSDYDARFIYCHPQDYYLSVGLEDKRDVIEYPITDDIDLNGWDIRKALKLLNKSNPAIVEWLQSPIIYTESGQFATQARALLNEIYSCEKGIYHYKSMAKTNYRGYLQNELVPLKKYFYVLRPLLSVRWLERYNQPAPIEFHKLLPLLPEHSAELAQDINTLLAQKLASPELGLAPAVASINGFIEEELQRLALLQIPGKSEQHDFLSELDQIFHGCLQ